MVIHDGALLHLIDWYSQSLQLCIFREDVIIQLPDPIALQRPVEL